MKKLAALGLTAALVFAPVVAFADDAPMPAPTDAAAPAGDTMAKPMKSHMMKHHHHSKHMMMKKHHMKKMMKSDAPAADAPAPDAPK